MTEIYLTISLSTHNGDDTPQKYCALFIWKHSKTTETISRKCLCSWRDSKWKLLEYKCLAQCTHARKKLQTNGDRETNTEGRKELWDKCKRFQTFRQCSHSLQVPVFSAASLREILCLLVGVFFNILHIWNHITTCTSVRPSQALLLFAN